VPFGIQRVPKGLNDVLNIFGGATPRELEDRVRGSLELIQYYGLQQRRVSKTNDPALAEGSTGLGIILSQTQWCVLFVLSVTVIKTATMTALRSGLFINRQSGGAAVDDQQVASEEQGPFGATESGAAGVIYVPPYPMLMPPGASVRGIVQILGTDATANTTLSVEFGVF